VAQGQELLLLLLVLLVREGSGSPFLGAWWEEGLEVGWEEEGGQVRACWWRDQAVQAARCHSLQVRAGRCGSGGRASVVWWGQRGEQGTA
jgi:hypothetical protein